MDNIIDSATKPLITSKYVFISNNKFYFVAFDFNLLANKNKIVRNL